MIHISVTNKQNINMYAYFKMFDIQKIFFRISRKDLPVRENKQPFDFFGT